MRKANCIPEYDLLVGAHDSVLNLEGLRTEATFWRAGLVVFQAM